MNTPPPPHLVPRQKAHTTVRQAGVPTQAPAHRCRFAARKNQEEGQKTRNHGEPGAVTTAAPPIEESGQKPTQRCQKSSHAEPAEIGICLGDKRKSKASSH